MCRYVQTPEPVEDQKCFECDSQEVRRLGYILQMCVFPKYMYVYSIRCVFSYHFKSTRTAVLLCVFFICKEIHQGNPLVFLYRTELLTIVVL